jgi:hypothetical protein
MRSLEQLAELVDRAGWALAGEHTAAAVAAEHHLLAAGEVLRSLGAQAAGHEDDPRIDPRGELAAACEFLDGLADAHDRLAVIALAAHLRAARRVLAGR